MRRRGEEHYRSVLHEPTYRMNSWLFVAFIGLAVALWFGLPDEARADRSTTWLILVGVGSYTFIQTHLIQRFLVVDAESALLNVPYKREFQRLPVDRKIPLVRRINRMLGLMNAGMMITFAFVLLRIYFGIVAPGTLVHAAARQGLWVCLSVVTAGPIFEVFALRNVIRSELRSAGLLDAPGGRG